MQSRRSFLKMTAALAGLGILAPLNACSSDSGSSAAGSVADGKVKIEYWHTNPESRGGKTVDAQVAAFNKQSKNVEVVTRYNDGYDGLMKNLQADAAAGKTPDLVQVSYSNIEYFPTTFPYTPADEVAKLAGKDSFITDNFADNIIKLGSNNEGKLVGFPYAVSDPILYYNKDVLDSAGISQAPETWEELQEAAKTITEKTGKPSFYLQESDTWALQGLLNCNGGQMLEWKGNKATATLDDAANVKAMQLYADMVLKDKTALHMSNDEGLKAIDAGEVAMYASSCANLAGIEGAAQFTVGTAKFPVFEGKQRELPAGGCVLAVMAQDDSKKKAVMEFISYLFQDENIADWVKGTGYVAHTKTAPDSEAMKKVLADDPLREAASSQVDNIVPWTAWPGDSAQQVQQLISDMRDQVLGGTKEPAAALQDANDKINELLK